MLFDRIGCRGLDKARPSGTGIVFLLRRKERLSASGTTIEAFTLVIVIGAGKRLFGSFFSQYAILLRGEALFPLDLVNFDLIHYINSFKMLLPIAFGVLKPIERRVRAVLIDQFVVGARFDEAPIR